MQWQRARIPIAVVMLLVAGAGMVWAQVRGQRGRGQPGQPFFRAEPIAKDDAEKRILDVLDDMYQNERRGMMNVPPDDGRLLRVLAETTNAQHVVEIGTSNGYSGIWICLGLLRTGGKLTTHEIDEGRAALARENFRRVGVEDRVTLVMGDAHEQVTRITEPIDILFLDADKEGYIDYLNKLLPRIRPGGLILAHNINPGQADRRFLEAISTNPELETIVVNSQPTGMGVTLKKR